MPISNRCNQPSIKPACNSRTRSPSARNNAYVKTFSSLTSVGKLRRLQSCALDVVRDRFGLANARVALISSHSFNSVFRVDCQGGQRFALRVGDGVRIHAADVEEIEATWLATLGSITSLRCVPNVAGQFTTVIEDDRLDHTRVVSLMTWVPGNPLRDRLDADAMRHAGRLLAALHERSSELNLQIDVTNVTANRVIYFGVKSLLAAHETSQGTLFSDATARAQETLNALWAHSPHTPHLLHGDFGPHNVMRWRDALTPIDFQDLQFGFDAQDLGIAIAVLTRKFPVFVDAFQLGYRDVRPWPSACNDLETMAAFTAMRSLNVLNLSLNLQRFGSSEFTAAHTAIVKEWMKKSSRGPGR